MKSIAAIVAGAAVVLSVSACSSEPPTFEECAAEHGRLIQTAVAKGFQGTPVGENLLEFGCGQWYQEELSRRAGVSAPVTQTPSITPPVTPQPTPTTTKKQAPTTTKKSPATTKPKPATEPGYVDPLDGADEGYPPVPGYLKGYSCTLDYKNRTVCEGNVPPHIKYITPAQSKAS